jgi:hypothetical protein
MIRNFTPHAINLPDRTIPPEPTPARVQEVRHASGQIDGIPVEAVSYGAVTGLPDFQVGTYLIVSSMVAAAAPDRRDLLTPGKILRDADNRIIGCSSLTLANP